MARCSSAPFGSHHPAHIVTGRQRVGAQVAGGVQQVAELDPLVAADTGDRRFAAQVAVGEIVHHALREPVLVIEDVMGDADPVGHLPRIVDVLAGAARSLAAHRHAVVVKLEGDPDHVVTLLTQKGGGDGGVDTAGHGDHDAGVRGPLCDTERVQGASSGASSWSAI